MTDEFPTDSYDTDLQELFAGMSPSADFEDRLVTAVRQHRRMQIPAPVKRAALAAAAMLAVGVVGYVGNQAMIGQLRFAETANREKCASNLHQMGLAILLDQGKQEEWDFGGGSNSAQNWTNWNGTSGITEEKGGQVPLSSPDSSENWTSWNGTSDIRKNQNYRYTDPFAGGKAVANGWALKNPNANYDVASDINPGREQDLKSLPSQFTGTQHDNIAAHDHATGGKRGQTGGDAQKGGQVPLAAPFISGGTLRASSSGSSPHDNLDSILLPYDGSDGNDTTRGQGMSGADSADSAKDTTVASRQKGGQIPLSAQVPLSAAPPTHYFSADTAQDSIRNADESGLEQTVLKSADQKGGRDQKGGQVPLSAQIVSGTLQLPVIEVPDQKTVAIPLAAPATNTTQPAPLIDDRKIIRTGTMEFVVDRFDTAQMQITKIVQELGGFVGATDSTKLPNGKVRGSISVRVPPERLDLLVLSLRALGDLKSQQITAADITKEYTDIQSELKADYAMQERLLELIHNGKGSVKDLLAAENELGTWRTKIEKAEGMIRYYDGQIGLSTLVITLSERDIQTPATAVETETADMGIEAEDVEKARDSALKAIDDVKGRIVEAELKRFDAGQLAARLVADVPPDSAGAVIDQLKQLGKVARLEINRQETNSDGSATVPVAAVQMDPAAAENAREIDKLESMIAIVQARIKQAQPGAELPVLKTELGKLQTELQQRKQHLNQNQGSIGPLHTERKPTRLLVSIYNLANVAPRRTTNVTLAADDVESAYAALVTAAKSDGGRVVTSALDRGDAVKATGSLVLEFPPDKFESVLSALHAQGDVLKLTLTENPDTQNSTEAKAGLTVQLVSLASVPARESIQQTLASPDVPGAYQAVLDAAAAAHARVQSAQLNEQDRQNISADLQLEIPRSAQAQMDKALAGAGGTIARTTAQSAQAEGTVDSKVQLHLNITSADHLPPRETTRLQVEVADVDRSSTNAQSAAVMAGGRVLEATVTRDDGKGLARVALDLPLDKAAEILQQIRNEGTVRGIDASRDPQAPAGPLAHARILVEFTTTQAIVADQTGPWASVRQGLSTSIRGLLWSLQWVVVGLCLIGPWAGVGWIVHRLWRRKIRMTKFEASNQ